MYLKRGRWGGGKGSYRKVKHIIPILPAILINVGIVKPSGGMNDLSLAPPMSSMIIANPYPSLTE